MSCVEGLSQFGVLFLLQSPGKGLVGQSGLLLCHRYGWYNALYRGRGHAVQTQIARELFLAMHWHRPRSVIAGDCGNRRCRYGIE